MSTTQTTSPMPTVRLWRRHPRLFIFAILVAGGITFLAFGGLRLLGDASASAPAPVTPSVQTLPTNPGSSSDLGVLDGFVTYSVPEGNHKVTIILDSEKWSGKLILPWDHTLRVDGAHVDVRNNSGRIFEIRSEKAPDFGVESANTVLQFRGTGTATVYVKRNR